jgi:preprotein translocase subunit SecF
MDTSQLHHRWTFWRRIKPWYFLVMALISGITCIFALRTNNLHMVQLRDAVYQADKDNGDVEGALRKLREYVYSHMNTDLAAGNSVRPPIQLKYTYERLVAARNAKSTASTANNSEIYNQAQQYCEQANPNGISGRFRLDCVENYVKTHNLASASSAEPIPKNLYQFDFVSPRWSPDLAGWSLLATAFFVVCFIIDWIFQHIVRRMVA